MKQMEGKTCLITGATSGIGSSAALKLSNLGADICFIARNSEKARNLSEEIFKKSGKKPTSIIADLSSQEEIKRAADKFIKSDKPIDVLLNNAGIMSLKRNTTIDGLEEVFAVNHLAYFSLTLRLMDRILESSPARIVNVASGAHSIVKRMNFDDLNSEKSFKTMQVYGQSKLANILFTKKLSNLLKSKGVTVNCLHPGFVSTSIGSQNQSIVGNFLFNIARPFARTIDKGAETSIYLCSSPEVSKISGEYFFDCKIKEVSEGAKNESDADKLWEISSKMTGLSYP